MIRVNGEAFPLRDGMNVRELIEEMDFDETKIAVEYNGEILPKCDYGKTILHDGDVLEVVSFVGGG